MDDDPTHPTYRLTGWRRAWVAVSTDTGCRIVFWWFIAAAVLGLLIEVT